LGDARGYVYFYLTSTPLDTHCTQGALWAILQNYVDDMRRSAARAILGEAVVEAGGWLRLTGGILVPRRTYEGI